MKFATKVIFGALLYSTLVLAPLESEAQLWFRYRHEIFGGVGASQMLGDLGGGPNAGSGLADINMGATNVSLSLGYRYKLSPKAALRLSVGYLRLEGDDAFTENEGRMPRNLSVQTNVTEFSPMIEFYLISDDMPKTTRYRGGYFRRSMRNAGPKVGLYIATGLTIFSYNPTAELDGVRYDLRDLGTEGQGIEPGSSKYSTVDFALPVNIGFKINFDQTWSIALEAAARFTATDYLDDVSTDYYDNDAIRDKYGDAAAELADRRLNSARGSEGGIRGSSENNDAYFYLQLQVAKRLKSYKSSTRKRKPSF